MRIAPNGCGKLIEGNIPCGDHIDLETDESGRCLCQPVLCKQCWNKYRKEND